MSNEDTGEVVKQPVLAIEVRVRRDANTIGHVRVMPYELPILAKLYGKDNVQKIKDSGTHMLETENEYQRLSAKYGPEVMVAVWGDDEGMRLGEHVSNHQGPIDAASTSL